MIAPALGDRAPGILGAAYAFPAASRTIRELAGRGLLRSDPTLLESFGFARVRVAVEETPYQLALRAVSEILERTRIPPEEVDLVLWGGPQGATAFVPAPSAPQSSAAHRTTARFRFPGARLQHELGLTRAQVIGLDQLACASLFAAVRLARALCLAEGASYVLCVASEFFPADAGREAIFNCTSDAAVAVLVDGAAERNRIRSSVHVTKGCYWDPDALPNELVAAYFPTAKHVLERTMAGAGWSASEIDWVIPHNVGWRSWEILLSLSGLRSARVWRDNIARDGHTVAGDNFINLSDALASGAIAPGEKLLLFTFGYGAHWSGLALEA